jgi:hypothetical protein
LDARRIRHATVAAKLGKDALRRRREAARATGDEVNPDQVLGVVIIVGSVAWMATKIVQWWAP